MQADVNSGHTLALVKDIAKGRCIPFIGAGFSANAKGGNVPCYAELAERLRKRLPEGVREVELSPADVFRRLLDDFGERIVNEWVCEEIGDPEPGAAHEALVSLPWEALVTTNYDRLLEKAYAFRQQKLPVVRNSDRQLGSQDVAMASELAPLIVKAHGACTCQKEMIVAPSALANDQYEATHPNLCKFMEDHLQDKSAVFIGYALEDENINYIRRALEVKTRDGGGHVRRDYIVAVDPSADELARWNADKSLVQIILSTEGTGLDKGECLAEFWSAIERKLSAEGTEAASILRVARYFWVDAGKVAEE